MTDILPADPRDDRGFTLIELMVVVLIIAVLIAIAIPTYFGARQTANDRAIQANVRTAFGAVRVYYNEKLSYTTDTVAMRGVEPSILWTTSALDASSPSRAIGVRVYDVPTVGQTVVVVGRTSSGRCFYVKDVMGGATAGTYYQRDVSGAASCPDVDPTTITLQNWNV